MPDIDIAELKAAAELFAVFADDEHYEPLDAIPKYIDAAIKMADAMPKLLAAWEEREAERSVIEQFAERIVVRWDAWEEDAGQVGQVQQDSDAAHARMVELVGEELAAMVDGIKS